MDIEPQLVSMRYDRICPAHSFPSRCWHCDTQAIIVTDYVVIDFGLLPPILASLQHDAAVINYVNIFSRTVRGF